MKCLKVGMLKEGKGVGGRLEPVLWVWWAAQGRRRGRGIQTGLKSVSMETGKDGAVGTLDTLKTRVSNTSWLEA